MITMEMFGKIRRMYLRDKLSLHEITKRTGLSRNTIRRWLRSSEDAAVPTYRRKAEPCKLAAFHEVLGQALKADALRAKQNRRTAKDLFAQIKADGYAGGYSQLTAFIRDWRDRGSKTPHAFVPLKFELGEAFQFDWSEEGLVVGGSRRRIWLDAQSQRFGSFAELNAWLGERCRFLWGELRHPEYRELSVADMLEQEHAHMMPVPTPFDGYVEKLSRVSGTCLINVHRNHYSVPCELAGQMVSTRLYPDRVIVVAGDAVVACHDRLTERGHILYDWQHYILLVERKPGALRNGAPFADMPVPLQQLRRGLMRHAGGDRIMAQVLAAVPSPLASR